MIELIIEKVELFKNSLINEQEYLNFIYDCFQDFKFYYKKCRLCNNVKLLT